MSQSIPNSPELFPSDTAPPNTAPIAVFGHKTPDTDAIVSALAASEWLNQQGISAKAYRLGELNKETQYLISQISDITVPPLLNDLPNNLSVCLVDHNESQQSIDNLAELTISHVIDHHKLGDLQTSEPAFIHLRPFGSCSTIIFTLMQQDNVIISPSLARLLAGAIISDTLNLTSPTTTDIDRYALADLAKTASIDDIPQFANDLFEAKSDISDLTDEQLITSDYKQFNFQSHQNARQNILWGIAVIETVQPEQVFSRTAGLQSAIKQIKTRDKLDYLLVIVVDILHQQSWAIASDDQQDDDPKNGLNTLVEKAFATQKVGDKIALGNRVSRKKQFVPALEKFYLTTKYIN